VRIRTARLGLGGGIGIIIIYFVVFLLILICMIPIVNIAALSFSSQSAIISSKVGLWPVELTTEAYKALLGDRSMVYSLFYTLILTAMCAVISLTLSVAAAYALTKKRLKGRGFFLAMIIVTMYFSGGIIPDYLLVKTLGMMNKIWCLVFPGCIYAYYVLILKSFFTDLPESFEESAIIDGANELQVLWKIVLPLSGPVLASIGLFYAVGRWNGFQDALFYITNPKLYPIQLKLYNIVMLSTSLDIVNVEGGSSVMMFPESLKAATILFATVPILLVYPWLQKYFIKGVMIGGIKG
jgi:putative aldouronate transport system permease protein